MSEKIWSDDAWEDYLYWQTQDKKTLKRINQLIQDIERNGCMKGIGKPEPLSGDLQGEYSRRINEKTASSTIWKMGGSTSPTAEATMEINNPPPIVSKYRTMMTNLLILKAFRKETIASPSHISQAFSHPPAMMYVFPNTSTTAAYNPACVCY